MVNVGINLFKRGLCSCETLPPPKAYLSKILTLIAPHRLVRYNQRLNATRLAFPIHSQVRLSLPPGEQESGSSLNIRPLNTPQLPVELWDEIGEILSENVVASTAQDLLNVMLSCRELFQIFMRHLYKFNKRMIEKSSLSPPPGSGPPRRRKPKNGWTERSAMQWAARNGLQGTAQAVREITPDLCQVSHVGVAIRHQHYEFAWMLLKWKEIDEKVAAGVSHDSPIFAAVAMNHAALIEYITKLQGIKVDVFDSDFKTVLHHACENGHLKLVQRFLDMGADLMSQKEPLNRRSSTAFELAISHDSASARVAVVKEILSRKAKLMKPAGCMRIIAKYDRPDVLDIFIQEGIFETYLGEPEPEQLLENWLDTLFKMAESTAVGAFRRILELCPEECFTDVVIDEILASACQPLHRRNKSQTRFLTLKISQLLIDHVRVLRNNDLSSLPYEELLPSIVESIISDEFLMTEYILSIFGPLKNGQFPVHEKCLGAAFLKSPRSSEMLSVLINHGLDVNQAVERIPLLMHALRLLKLLANTIGVVKDLVSMIQDIDQQDLYGGDTSLMFWLRDSQEMVGEPGEEALCLEITELLLDHGASLDSRNRKGNTPLHIATGYCYPSAVQLLIDRGADVNATGNRGETAIHWATNGICSAPEVDRQDRQQQDRSAIEKVTILIKAHADPDSISDNGSMALRPLPEAWLCHDSFEKMVEIYTSSARDRGDPINVVDFLHRRSSLLRYCAFIMNMENSGSEKMEKDFEFLLGSGLDIDEHNYRGETLLDLSLAPGSIPGNYWLFIYLLSKGAKINATNQNGKTVLDRTRDVSIRDLLIRHGALLGSQLEKSAGN